MCFLLLIYGLDLLFYEGILLNNFLGIQTLVKHVFCSSVEFALPTKFHIFYITKNSQ